VATKWYDLGVQLRLNVDQLNIIKANNPGDTETCCSEMYQLWLRSDSQASLEKLAMALKDTGFDVIADSVKSGCY